MAIAMPAVRRVASGLHGVAQVSEPEVVRIVPRMRGAVVAVFLVFRVLDLARAPTVPPELPGGGPVQTVMHACDGRDDVTPVNPAAA